MSASCSVCHNPTPEGADVCPRCDTPVDFGVTMDLQPAAAPWNSSETIDLGTVTPVPAPKTRNNPAGPFEPGDVLADRYEILSVLGRGGMGVVYKARDREVEHTVAIKLINPELASRPDIVLRFKHELILARQITHKNVVRIFDIYLSETSKFITMQFVAGEDLYSHIAKAGKLPVDEACAIFRQSLLGLSAAHEEGIVHRDLKPHNIMVSSDGHACLMDFGVASSVETAGMTRTGVLMGTPDYMSPEQARGEKADSRSDIFSMGVILFEMLTGALPYPGANSISKLIKRTREKAPDIRELNPAIPEYLAGIVARCLEIRPEERYTTAAEILEDLDARIVFCEPRVAHNSVSDSSRLAPGSHFGSRYRIDSLLGEGAMGTVYKAWDNELGRPVALKLVRSELSGKPAYFDKLKQEILLASRISHRNILRIHDLGDVDGLKFISMAYIDGPDLAQLIHKQGRLPVPRALLLATQLCQALAAAHEEGVVHRDLKPQNVLVDQEDHAYISDFGLATTACDEPGSQIMGTPQYMAPEQVECLAVDHRADLYAFGLILCEMVSGDLPFKSETAVQTMFQRVTQAPRHPKLLNPDMPDALAAVILRCLEKDPALRYQNANEILANLATADQDSIAPLPQPAAPLPELVPPPRRRARHTKLGLTVAVMVALLAAIPQTRQKVMGLMGRSAGTPDPAKAHYLAILPLRVAGDDPALALLADGIVDSLSTRLAQLRDIHLASPAAAARINPQDPLLRISQALGARELLHGEISGDATRVQIVLSVNEPATGKRLWTKQFSGLRQDILTIQDEIYNELIAALNLKLSREDLARGATRPTDDVTAFGSYLEGRNLLRAKRNEANLTSALKQFEAAAAKDPNFALAYTGIADASLALYDLKKDGVWVSRALGAANHAQQLNDRLPEVHFALGSVYSATGKTAEAIAELKRALELAPNSDEAYRRIGRAYRKAGLKPEGVKALEEAVKANPYYWLNYNLLGIALLEAGKSQEALKAFRKVTEIDPSRPSGWSNIGSVEHNLGQWEESVAMYRKAVQLQPSAINYSNLGAGVYFLGRCEEARENFQKAADINPDYVTLGNLASAYRCLGQTQKADPYFDQAITKALQSLQVNPKDAATIANLGVYYSKVGDSARALQFARRARKLDPANPQVLYQNAIVDALTGDRAGAVTDLREAIAKGASVKEALNDPDLKTLAGESGLAALKP